MSVRSKVLEQFTSGETLTCTSIAKVIDARIKLVQQAVRSLHDDGSIERLDDDIPASVRGVRPRIYRITQKGQEAHARGPMPIRPPVNHRITDLGNGVVLEALSARDPITLAWWGSA